MTKVNQLASRNKAIIIIVLVLAGFKLLQGSPLFPTKSLAEKGSNEGTSLSQNEGSIVPAIDSLIATTHESLHGCAKSFEQSHEVDSFQRTVQGLEGVPTNNWLISSGSSLQSPGITPGPMYLGQTGHHTQPSVAPTSSLGHFATHAQPRKQKVGHSSIEDTDRIPRCSSGSDAEITNQDDISKQLLADMETFLMDPNFSLPSEDPFPVQDIANNEAVYLSWSENQLQTWERQSDAPIFNADAQLDNTWAVSGPFLTPITRDMFHGESLISTPTIRPAPDVVGRDPDVNYEYSQNFADLKLPPVGFMERSQDNKRFKQITESQEVLQNKKAKGDFRTNLDFSSINSLSTATSRDSWKTLILPETGKFEGGHTLTGNYEYKSDELENLITHQFTKSISPSRSPSSYGSHDLLSQFQSLQKEMPVTKEPGKIGLFEFPELEIHHYAKASGALKIDSPQMKKIMEIKYEEFIERLNEIKSESNKIPHDPNHPKEGIQSDAEASSGSRHLNKHSSVVVSQEEFINYVVQNKKDFKDFFGFILALNQKVMMAMGCHSYEQTFQDQEQQLFEWILEMLIKPSENFTPFSYELTNPKSKALGYLSIHERIMNHFSIPKTTDTVKFETKSIYFSVSIKKAEAVKLAIHLLGAYYMVKNPDKWGRTFCLESTFMNKIKSLMTLVTFGNSIFEKFSKEFKYQKLIPWELDEYIYHTQ